MKLTTIHPFPARMAPELVYDALKFLPVKGRVLDPMCGSGTVPRLAVEAGHECVGVDIDPLSVSMARVWTSRFDPDHINEDAENLAQEAKSLNSSTIQKPGDPETQRFITYWFAMKQQDALARLATVLMRCDRPTKPALLIALSRIIVSKKMMASLARDTSHSRPHRVAHENNFNVYEGFQKSAQLIGRRLLPERIVGTADILSGDARTLDGIKDSGFDMVLTSPPYLNAIDYLRGHRMALVWMGHTMKSLRKTRSESVGAERILPQTIASFDISPFVVKTEGATLRQCHLGWIRRYAADMKAVLDQAYRTLKPNGYLIMVVGNSFIRGAKVNNAGLIETLAIENGFKFHDRRTRKIPARRRYLPPPGNSTGSLDTRMRTETVLTLRPDK